MVLKDFNDRNRRGTARVQTPPNTTTPNANNPAPATKPTQVNQTATPKKKKVSWAEHPVGGPIMAIIFAVVVFLIGAFLTRNTDLAENRIWNFVIRCLLIGAGCGIFFAIWGAWSPTSPFTTAVTLALLLCFMFFGFWYFNHDPVVKKAFKKDIVLPVGTTTIELKPGESTDYMRLPDGNFHCDIKPHVEKQKEANKQTKEDYHYMVDWGHYSSPMPGNPNAQYADTDKVRFKLLAKAGYNQVQSVDVTVTRL
jgi:hypothetical protein